MTFSVNFMSRASVVLKEALLFKKYKAMPLVWAIIVGILMLPLTVASLISALFVYVLGYLFSIVSLPVQSLHKLLKEEGQAIRHGAQIVVYLLSWGFIFTAYAALSFLLVLLTVLYSLFSIFTYLWTLGGFKFHLFPEDEDISVEVTGEYKTLLLILFVAIMGALLVAVPLIGTLITLIKLKFQGISFDFLISLFRARMHGTDTLRLLVSAIYSAVIFAPGPKQPEA